MIKAVTCCLLFLVAVCESGPLFSRANVQQWLQARCGNGAAVWAYEGTLYDPLDGRKICDVEGLELIRTLPAKARTGLVGTELTNGTTVLSRKLFCYKSNDKLLESIKLRHNSPKRTIPKNQAAVVYDTATTLSSRGNGKQLVLHTEFPNGKCYWATTKGEDTKSDMSADSSFDFTVYTKRRPTDLPTENEMTEDGVVVAPKRSKIFQFGASPKQDNLGRFGARETYSYTVTPAPLPEKGWKFWVKPQAELPSCAVKYTRYGEGPPWYGPGKYCSLELRGRRVDSLQDALPLVHSFAAQIPGFMQVHRRLDTPKEGEDAISWFRKEGMQLEETTSHDGGLKGQAVEVWNKLRSASRHVAGKLS